MACNECLNLITEADGVPGCVLIRGVRGVSGPGRLTRAFGISRKHKRLPVFEPRGEGTAAAVGERTGEARKDVAEKMQRLKWNLWHGNVCRALERIEELECELESRERIGEPNQVAESVARMQGIYRGQPCFHPELRRSWNRR